MLIQRSITKSLFHPRLFERFILGIKNPMKLYGKTYWAKRRLSKQGFPQITINLFLKDLQQEAETLAGELGLCYYPDHKTKNAIGITFPQLYLMDGKIDHFHHVLEKRMKELGW